MKELSLNVLDIAENSAKAGAKNIKIEIIETEETLSMSISDDGCGMKPDFLADVTNPFRTTRTTRKVGLGIPFLKLQAEQTGGSFQITSRHVDEYPDDHGTVTSAVFCQNHIDMTPLGDISASIVTLIQGHPAIDFLFVHQMTDRTVTLDTRDLREVLGDVPLDLPEVVLWLSDYLREQYQEEN